MARIPAFVLMLLVAALVAAALANGRPVPGAPNCPMTPADSFWHADVSALPVHPQSATWVSSIGTTAGLKADFGSGTWNGGPIGIPYTTVPGTQPRVPVTFGYADESDPGPYPIPPDAPIEGGSSSSGDRHILLVDRDACRLWEIYSAYPQSGGASWTAGSGATWSLTSNVMRPLGWTSGDAAGLPILPGLVRRDEVLAGEIDHVIRFTAPRTASAYVWPASHKAGTGGASDPPMGTWFRLEASYDISGFSAANQVILRALKKHGMVLADNGSAWFMSGAPDPGWDNSELNALRAVPGSAFEAVDVSSLKVSNTSYAVAGAALRLRRLRRLRPRKSSSPTVASRRAFRAGASATVARRLRVPAPSPTRAHVRRSSAARARGETRSSMTRRRPSPRPLPGQRTWPRRGCARRPAAPFVCACASGAAARSYARARRRFQETAAGAS